MRKIFTSFILLFSLQALALDPNHFTITRVSAPYFIVDGNSPATITKAYVGFEVKNNSNSATTYSSLKFAITSISTSVAGQNYSVVAPVSGIINIGTLSPGQSKVCYYYISYPASVTPQGTFNIQLSDNTASSKTQSFIIRNRSSISANAGGTATQSFTNQDIIGGIILDDVTYVVGNVQNTDESDFQVAVSTQFDPTLITLLGTQVIASSVPGIPVGATDSLYYITGNGTNGATITMRWTFRITGYNFTTYLLPCAGATSGSTNYKYALNTSLGSGTPVTISSTANPLTITKTSDQSLYGTNATALFTVTIQNPGAYGVTVDKIIDEVPAGFSFQSFDAASQVTTANSTRVPSAGSVGAITFEGGVVSGANTSYYIASGGSLVLKYTATSPSTTASNLITTVRDYVGVTEIGSAQNTVSVSATLPVTLVSFKAIWVNDIAKLNWISANETNSYLFEVEKATGNGPYRKIGKVLASGNTSENRSYSFVDSFPVTGANYYRLKAVDLDQHFRYSHVVSLTKQHDILVEAIYPNPFMVNINLELIAEKKQTATFRLVNLEGKLVLQKAQVLQRGSSTIQLDEVGKLNPGIYFLNILTDAGSYHIRIVKIQ
ncbi:MAG: T9SS type A sorting domain-containing protein [Chitinophagaceae bacterium]